MEAIVNWHQFNWVDYTIIGIVVVSTIISCVRGFMREAISLTAWVIAFWVAFVFAPPLGESALLTTLFSSPSLRLIAAFVGLFIAVLILGGLINFILGKLVNKVGLSGIDRLIGLKCGIN